MKMISVLITIILAQPQFGFADGTTTQPSAPIIAKKLIEKAASIYKQVDDLNHHSNFPYNLLHQLELATALLSIRDTTDGESLLDQQRESHRLETDPREIESESYRIQLARIKGYSLAADWKKANELITLVPPPTDLNYGDMHGAAIGTLAWAAAKRGHNHEAIECYRAVYEYSMTHPAYSDESKAIGLAEGLAPAQYTLGEKVDAEKTFRAAMKISTSAPPRDAATIRTRLVESLAKLGELDMACEVISLAADTSEQHFLWRWLMKSLTDSGQLDEAVRIGDTHDFLWSACENCEMIANAYSKAGKPEEAKKFIDKAEADWKQITDPGQIGTRITRAYEIGQSHGLAGDKESAGKWFKVASDITTNTTVPESGPLAKAMPVDQTVGSNFRMNFLRSIAETESKYGFADQARQDLQNALVAAHGEQPGMWSGVSINEVAKSMAMAGFPDDAIQTMNREGFRDTQGDVWIAIVCAYGRLGKLDQALHAPYASAGYEELTKQYLRGGDLNNALKVGLLLKDMEFVMHDVGYAFGRKGDIQPILDAATDKNADPDVQINLLLGAADGLLDVVPDSSVIQPHPTTRPMPVYAQ